VLCCQVLPPLFVLYNPKLLPLSELLLPPAIPFVPSEDKDTE
jgi:hypothetical protein